MTVLLILLTLADTLPPLHTVERFAWVTRDQVQELLVFNAAYYSHLYKSCEIRRTEWEVEAMKETRLLYDAWDNLRDALMPNYSDLTRRKALGRIREIVGEEMFQRGQMPCFVPVWRFVEVR